MLIEVVYALETRQSLLSLHVPENTTLEQAIHLSGILKLHPQLVLSENLVGIFGRKYPFNTILREKDRVEIYRPLMADPKASRPKRRKLNKK
jgi:putative ubiquitin-RnfH superfamily antitoxin RatB of RatAB toxin-antitoxin module